MYYKLKSNISIFIFIIAIIVYLMLSIIITKAIDNSMEDKLLSKTTNKSEIVIDAYEYVKVMPKNFRSTSNLSLIQYDKALNIQGMYTLDISGSEQFSAYNLLLLKDSIKGNLPITIIDLRQESHGFVNEYAVSWQNENNNSNIGLTKDKILLRQKSQLKNLKIGHRVVFDNIKDYNTIIKTIKDEKTLLSQNNIKYIYIPVTDRTLPLDDTVDFFVNAMKDIKNKHLHFHCKFGIGRTTTFMIMYDIMKNYKVAKVHEIISRQLALANIDDDTIQRFYSKDRVEFLENFYKYCQESGDNFKLSWSKWSKTM